MFQTISHYLKFAQEKLFPHVQANLPDLTPQEEALIKTLEFLKIEDHVPNLPHSLPGQQPASRKAIARAFVAKSCLRIATTSDLVQRLKGSPNLCRIVGFDRPSLVPSDATFSRAFTAFAKTLLPGVAHNTLIRQIYDEELVTHVSHDSSFMDAREKAIPKPPAAAPAPESPHSPAGKALAPEGLQAPDSGSAPPVPSLLLLASEAASKKQGRPKKGRRLLLLGLSRQPAPPAGKRGRGRPRKGEVVPPPDPTRLERQAVQSLEASLAELPRGCDWACKQNSQGKMENHKGYKLHLSVAEGGVPLTPVFTSASTHDSQVAVPLMGLTAQRVTYLYDLMDSAYDAGVIKQVSRNLNHVPIIDPHPRGGEALPLEPDRQERYKERSSVERAFSRLKDEFGANNIWVKGPEKVFTHVMFAVLALTADALMRLPL